MEKIGYPMPSYRSECQICAFGTGSSVVSTEGEHPKNTLKNCAKTAAEINMRQAREIDKFQHVQRGYLEFCTNRARPPWFATCCSRVSFCRKSR
jgi:hypothetical protein